MKRLTLILTLSLTLGVLAGCGAQARNIAWCAYHAERLIHDARHGHRGWAAVQGLLVAHSCSKTL